MADPIGVLEDLEIEEVSFVAKPANDQADVVIFKSADGKPFNDEDRENLTKQLVATFDGLAVYKDKIDDLKAALVVEMRKKLIAALKEATTPVGLEDAFWHTMNELRKAATGPQTKEIRMADPNAEAITKERDTALAEVASLKEKVEALSKAAETKPDPIAAASPEVRERLEKAESVAKAAEVRVAALEAERDVAKFVAVVKAEMSHVSANHEDLGRILKGAKDALPEADFAELNRILKAASEQLKAGNVFKQNGRADVAGAADNPLVIVNKRAAELMKDNQKLGLGDAMSEVFKADQPLYDRYAEMTQVKV